MARIPLTAEQASLIPTTKIILNTENVGLTDEQFFRLCSDNRELRIELTAQKEIIIMSPTGAKTGWRNAEILVQLCNWARRDGTGLTFDSSAGFTLPNGAKRSPDASWIVRKRWDALLPEQQEMFAPICPDFVLELRSPTDTVAELQTKLEEYIANGARLGWLIDPLDGRAHIYRPDQLPECLGHPMSVNGDAVLPGFILDLREILVF